MSHIEEGKTNLVFADLPAILGNQEALAHHACIKLMRQAFSLVAKSYGGDVKAFYYNFDQEEQQTNTGLALHIPHNGERPRGQAIPRGIGLIIDEKTGTLTFRGDPWLVDKAFYALVQKQIIQKYTALSHAAALRLMGYQVSLQQTEDQKITITGATYA